MRYTEFKVGDKEFKLRLAANEMVNIERKIGGGNVLSIFLKEERIPSMEELLMVLHGSLQKFHHKFALKDTYDLYDEYVDEGGTFEDLIELMLEVFEVSGFFKKEDIEEGKAKLQKSKEEE
ncbi:DUF6096 family protein [Tissierella sp. Yu-01]|uniref:DUF6096 family protein n=1 Tax=Tissierella sp. Yu-01 TaxID=3035694 RepID=UPI00240E8688|nr:DUF6096 family protein [Tissierella sp. Yu-01]WFA10330.1 DUF6096 family protein [Tissierella sp. Yu-01]